MMIVNPVREPFRHLRPQDQTAKFIGRAGFCLEFDESKVINRRPPNQHPCLTWLPVDQQAGVPDANNQFVDAGFDPQGMGYSVGPFYFY